MKKILLLALLTAFFGNIAYAQQDLRCHTDEVYQESIKNNPDILRVRQQLEDFTADYVRNQANQRTTSSGTPLYIIPVVFHVLHNYGPENISDAQVLDAIRVINDDYAKRNSDTSQIIPPFISLSADMQIEFRLANIDPNGNCTNGIDRIVTNLTYNANDASKLNPWPNQKYVNIWVAHTLERSGAAAYAYLPSSSTPGSIDGILTRHNYTGSIGTSSPNNKRTLTHELGHVLNLLHPWGSGNEVGTVCGDDFVNDTPVTKGFDHCVTQSTAAICNPPVVENYQNFMDYSYCDVMFTPDQKTRMFAALNSGLSGRNNLWTNTNLIATGTDGSPINICSPNADFSSNRKEICAGRTVTFSDISWNGKATSWYWEFPGGTPSTSTDSMPVVTYSTPGLYDVLFVPSNNTGIDSLTRVGYVRVSGAANDTIPYFEDFETAGSFPATDGYIFNPDNGQTWTRITGVGYSGTSCIRINNYINSNYAVDEWTMPAIDMSNVMVPVFFNFYYSHAQRSSTSADDLALFGTSNCGETWSSMWSNYGANLSTAGIVSVSYTPSNISQWSQVSVAAHTYAQKARVRFKFRNTSDRGNNIYIDDINITGNLVSVDEVSEIDLGFALYPNPAASETKVQFKLSKTLPVTVQVTDLTGRLIQTVVDETLTSGLHELPVRIETPGIYLINLVVNGKFHARKLVIPGQ